MKFAILIDYANLFLNIKYNTGATKIHEIEHEISKILGSLNQKLKQPTKHSKKGINVVTTILYVLKNSNFGNPEEAYKTHDVQVKHIEGNGKSKDMKMMNQSQDDDMILMKDGRILVEKGQLDGLLVISNDGDFVALAEQVQQLGKYYWAGIHEGKNRASQKLRKTADLVLPLHELITDEDEGKALPIENDALVVQEEIVGPHISIYYQKRMILSYPITTKPIEIGRRSSSRFHFPQIDLTDYDLERVTSRQHATITPLGNRVLFTVHQECTRGTWKNKKRVYPAEQFFLEPGVQIVIGSTKGFGIQYNA